MNVGILTYHWEDNYGATMQAYATYKAIADLGHEPIFIDLRLPDSSSLLSKIIFSLKHRRFNAFRKRFFKNLTPVSYHSVDELRADPPLCDCYLTGSDQTWNPLIAKSLLPAYFLTFGNDSTRRVTYATSIGLNEWSGSEYISDSEISKALTRFSSLLLREDSGIRICREKFGHEATQVTDPVLLHTNYSEHTGEIHDSGEIICYKLIDDAGFYDMALSAARNLGLPPRSIGSVRHPKGFRASYPEKIGDWIRRFAEARYVITDSFHGTVFSLLYHRPFVVYTGDPKRVTRIESLLRQTGLTDRILHHGATDRDMIRVLQTPIDWNHVDNVLTRTRDESLLALSEALKQ